MVNKYKKYVNYSAIVIAELQWLYFIKKYAKHSAIFGKMVVNIGNTEIAGSKKST